MYSATIHIDLDSDYVLSDLKTVRDEPFSVYYFEVFDKDKIRFVINAGKHRDAIADILRESDAVQSVEFLSDSQLLIAKYSSGVLPIIHNNHGRLRNMSQFEGTRRIFDIVIFARENIKEIVKKLRSWHGSVRTASSIWQTHHRTVSATIRGAHVCVQCGVFRLASTC